MFIGNTFTKTDNVISEYSKIEVYDVEDEDIENAGNVVLENDFRSRISQIEDDVNSIIKLIENNYDVAETLDELKILSAKLY